MVPVYLCAARAATGEPSEAAASFQVTVSDIGIPQLMVVRSGRSEAISGSVAVAASLIATVIVALGAGRGNSARRSRGLQGRVRRNG